MLRKDFWDVLDHSLASKLGELRNRWVGSLNRGVRKWRGERGRMTPGALVEQFEARLMMTGTDVRVIDDGDAGYSSTPGWIGYGGQGYQNDVHYTAKGDGSKKATWLFTDLTPGTYKVAAAWSAQANRATDAPYVVTDATTGEVLAITSVNQELAPNDFSDSGASWELIGDALVVFGSQVSVTLSNSANEYVIADAVRLERTGDLPVGTPELLVVVNGQVQSTGKSIDLGDVYQGQTQDRTFTVTNLGTANLELGSGGIGVPAGFALSDEPEGLIVAPGESIHFTISRVTSEIGESSGVVWFTTNDSDEAKFETTLSSRVTSTPVVIDNKASGFSTAGTWIHYAGQGYAGSVHYAAAGNGSMTATWTFTGLDAGIYEVATTWSVHANRATDAAYTVRDVNSGTELAAIEVNQEIAPSDFSDGGAAWKVIGSHVELKGSVLTVTLDNAANEYVIADAVRLVKVGQGAVEPEIEVSFSDVGNVISGATVALGNITLGAPVTRTMTVHNAGHAELNVGEITLAPGMKILDLGEGFVVAPGASVDLTVEIDPTGLGKGGGVISLATDDEDEETFNTVVTWTGVDAPRVIDDGDAGFSTTAGWTYYPNQGYQNDVRYTGLGDGSKTATWTFNDLAPGLYRVSATWSAQANRATNAPYTITDTGNPSKAVTVLVNQESAPGDLSEAGVKWKDLAQTFEVTGSTLTVTLGNNANEYVIADAVRIQRVETLVQEPNILVTDAEGNPVNQWDTGTTYLGEEVTKTFHVTNIGNANLVFGPSAITLPAGYELTAGLGKSVLAPGESTNFTVMVVQTVGEYEGVLVISTNDPDQGDYEVSVYSNVIVNPAVDLDLLREYVGIYGDFEMSGPIFQGSDLTFSAFPEGFDFGQGGSGFRMAGFAATQDSGPPEFDFNALALSYEWTATLDGVEIASGDHVELLVGNVDVGTLDVTLKVYAFTGTAQEELVGEYSSQHVVEYDDVTLVPDSFGNTATGAGSTQSVFWPLEFEGLNEAGFDFWTIVWGDGQSDSGTGVPDESIGHIYTGLAFGYTKKTAVFTGFRGNNVEVFQREFVMRNIPELSYTVTRVEGTNKFRLHVNNLGDFTTPNSKNVSFDWNGDGVDDQYWTNSVPDYDFQPTRVGDYRSTLTLSFLQTGPSGSLQVQTLTRSIQFNVDGLPPTVTVTESGVNRSVLISSLVPIRKVEAEWNTGSTSTLLTLSGSNNSYSFFIPGSTDVIQTSGVLGNAGIQGLVSSQYKLWVTTDAGKYLAKDFTSSTTVPVYTLGAASFQVLGTQPGIYATGNLAVYLGVRYGSSTAANTWLDIPDIVHIEWGDGNFSEWHPNNTQEYPHQYAKAGSYVVTGWYEYPNGTKGTINSLSMPVYDQTHLLYPDVGIGGAKATPVDFDSVMVRWNPYETRWALQDVDVMVYRASDNSLVQSFTANNLADGKLFIHGLVTGDKYTVKLSAPTQFSGTQVVTINNVVIDSPDVAIYTNTGTKVNDAYLADGTGAYTIGALIPYWMLGAGSSLKLDISSLLAGNNTKVSLGGAPYPARFFTPAMGNQVLYASGQTITKLNEGYSLTYLPTGVEVRYQILAPETAWSELKNKIDITFQAPGGSTMLGSVQYSSIKFAPVTTYDGQTRTYSATSTNTNPLVVFSPSATDEYLSTQALGPLFQGTIMAQWYEPYDNTTLTFGPDGQPTREGLIAIDLPDISFDPAATWSIRMSHFNNVVNTNGDKNNGREVLLFDQNGHLLTAYDLWDYSSDTFDVTSVVNAGFKKFWLAVDSADRYWVQIGMNSTKLGNQTRNIDIQSIGLLFSDPSVVNNSRNQISISQEALEELLTPAGQAHTNSQVQSLLAGAETRLRMITLGTQAPAGSNNPFDGIGIYAGNLVLGANTNVVFAHGLFALTGTHSKEIQWNGRTVVLVDAEDPELRFLRGTVSANIGLHLVEEPITFA